MRTLDDATLDRIIEQITHNVLVLLEEDASAPPNPAPALSPHNFAEHLRPVVHAGADRIGTTLGVAPTDGQLGHMIDHTLLKPDATQDQIAQLCFEARKFSFASVCVNPSYVRLCTELLKGSPVVVCTVVGFPLGATPTEVKVYEAQQAIRDGATEIDMVINVGAVKSRDYELAERDIASVARACRAGNALLKVILEAALLTDEEKVIACQLAKVAGADYVKTSTGFGPGGATAAGTDAVVAGLVVTGLVTAAGGAGRRASGSSCWTAFVGAVITGGAD